MTRLGPAAAALVSLSLASPEVAAQVDKPRFVFILDNSSSMSSNVGRDANPRRRLGEPAGL